MKSFRKCAARSVSVVAFVALSAGLQAGTVVMHAKLDGRHEFPKNASKGTGEATITLNDATGAVSVTGTYQGLGSNATAAHIHGLAAEGVNAGVMVPLTIGGGTDGTISGSGTVPADKIQGMLDGLTYVNVHSTDFGGGEIRGQVTDAAPVPVLPPWGLLALAVVLAGAAIGLLRRKRAFA